jgi:hypothetical protein
MVGFRLLLLWLLLLFHFGILTKYLPPVQLPQIISSFFSRYFAPSSGGTSQPSRSLIRNMPSQTGHTVQVSSDDLLNLFSVSLDLNILDILESDVLVVVLFSSSTWFSI